MSRIRVYDLAKEAGMPSKELAEKLLALGYDIKSHSSSVEDDIADEIRRKVIGTAETTVVEKRISTKGHTTIIRRRSQTVRRAPEPPPEEKEASVPQTPAPAQPQRELRQVAAVDPQEIPEQCRRPGYYLSLRRW